AGWDSDNPAATWGGLYGFILGKTGVEQAFGRRFSSKFNIHRTRKGFANNGIDNFDQMAAMATSIVDQVVQQEMVSKPIGLQQAVATDCWVIPAFVKPVQNSL
ncbi:MAG: hypothetical protein KKD00_06345, partial [Gammaproteobacteria bacterium]|nr:hypothetical protein [Gammaproteobacteria bacterium]